MQSKSWSNVAMAVAFQIASLSAAPAWSGNGETETEQAATVSTIKIDLPAQPLAEAIQSVARQTNTNILVDPRLVAGRQAPAISQQMSIDQALAALLHGTGLMPKFVDEKTITLVERNSSKPTAALSTLAASDAMRLAQADAVTPNGAQSPVPGDFNPSLEEVLVTAQKRSERLLEVPVPVTSINAESLINSNQLRLQDYYTNVPGFMVAPTSSQGSQIIAVRGLTTGQGSPTVGIMIDDVPYGSSTALGGGQGIPDLDPGDLQRIEVLRGPQGTLYGANSLGGLAKFVTVDPSTAGLSGRLQAGIGSIRKGDDLGYNIRGAINIPVGETFAVRASAFTRMEPGYIDNVALDEDDVNEETASGGRLGALWQPSEALSLKLSALYQKTEVDGVHASDTFDPFTGATLGDLQQAYVLEQSQEKKVKAYSAILNADLGGATLTSLTGYNIASFADALDGSAGFGQLLAPLYGGADGFMQQNRSETKKFSQELRLSAPLGETFETLLGAYYSRERTQFNIDFPIIDRDTLQTVDFFIQSTFPTRYEEYGAFANLTYKVTERFDIQVGGRYSDISQEARQTDSGFVWNVLFNGRADPFTVVVPEVKSDSFTYLVTPRLRLSRDVMLYARVATGYRTGGPNITVDLGVPQGYDPDKTTNYEIGLKGDFLNHSLTVDTSAYYIKWDNIQLFGSAPSGAGFWDNGGTAKSQGLELAVQARPLKGLTIAGWVAWNTAELTEDLDPAQTVLAGESGDRLPFSARFSGKIGVEQNFQLTSRVNAFAGVDLSYIGGRLSTFAPHPPFGNGIRSELPAYARTDLRLGAQYESWTTSLYVNNVTDRRGVLINGTDAAQAWSVQYIQPRTVGVTLVKTF